MKTLLTFALILTGVMALSTGCSTPGYTGGLPTARIPRERATGENLNNVVRTWYYDLQMITDDINAALLIDEPSRLTEWHVR